MTEIIRAHAEAIPGLSRMLTEAYTQEPLTCWLIEEQGLRRRFLQRFFELLIEQYTYHMVMSS